MYILSEKKNKSELMSTSPSCKFILYLLKQKGPMHPKEIVNTSLLTKRTVITSLNTLMELDCIKKTRDKNDKRMRIYELNF
jgi:DNA-binding MarR family transcriptional regulator